MSAKYHIRVLLLSLSLGMPTVQLSQGLYMIMNDDATFFSSSCFIVHRVDENKSDIQILSFCLFVHLNLFVCVLYARAYVCVCVPFLISLFFTVLFSFIVSFLLFSSTQEQKKMSYICYGRRKSTIFIT